MNACDVFDQNLHKHTIRYVAMKHRLSWILKPTFSILDCKFLNNFLIQRENNRNAVPNYRIFLLKLVQGLIGDCLRPDNEPIEVGRRGTNSRSICAECKDIGKRDSRTRLLPDSYVLKIFVRVSRDQNLKSKCGFSVRK